MTVTIRHIAAKLGLSESTVSRALTGKATLRPETVELVRKQAGKMGYIPNVVARSLAGNRSGLIGMALPALDYAHGEFYSAMTLGVEHTSEMYGYFLLVFPSKELGSSRFLFQTFLDGILILGPGNAPIQKPAKPVVVLDHKISGYPSIVSNNRTGAVEATKFLLEHGHRRILFIGGPAQHPTVRERFAGMKEAVRKFGGADVTLEATHVDWRRNSAAGRDAIAEVMAEGPWNHTAILAANDMLAAGAMTELQVRGFSVPGQVSVIGFDDSVLCDITSPPLTSVKQQPYEMGVAAMEQLHALITGSKAKARNSWTTTLMVRSSAGPAPQAPAQSAL